MVKSREWRTPCMLSAFGEFLVAVIAMLYWYSYSVTTWVSRGLHAALAGRMGPSITDQEIGFTAIIIFVTHPLTWLIGFLAVEGSVRLVGAACTERNLTSYVGAIREKVRVSRTGSIPDV